MNEIAEEIVELFETRGSRFEKLPDDISEEEVR